jgi:mannosyltransferase OCH1-like enzyme
MLLRSLPRRQSLLYLMILFTLCLCIIGAINQIFRSGSDNDLAKFKDENSDCARFDVRSPYRQNPDRDLEKLIDDALLAIQRSQQLKSQAEIPVRRIWQTWRDSTVPDDFDQPALWRELHPKWKYDVCIERWLARSSTNISSS